MKEWLTYLFDVIGTTFFAYLLLASLLVLWFNGYTSRISLMGFLIPHASKVALWSSIALLWLRPRFGWKFPFALLMLYCIAELVTNWIYVPVHFLTDPTYLSQWVTIWGNKNYYFILSNVFFILGIILANTFLKGDYRFKFFDWSMLPFGFFIGAWVALGYQTDSTALFATPMIEMQEFVWNVLYLLVMVNIFKPRGDINWNNYLFRS